MGEVGPGDRASLFIAQGLIFSNAQCMGLADLTGCNQGKLYIHWLILVGVVNDLVTLMCFFKLCMCWFDSQILQIAA